MLIFDQRKWVKIAALVKIYINLFHKKFIYFLRSNNFEVKRVMALDQTK